MLEIDGSHGEGGGQILRTALSLSCLTGTPFRIVDIRRGRRRPGLMPQHLASVRAALAISGGEATGAEPGATALTFTPGAVTGGEFEFHIGTAGSVSLLLQALLPPLLFAGRPSRLTLTGGIHVPASPSCHYLAEVFLPALARLGGEVRLAVERYGFYPAGGGVIRVEIAPAQTLLPLPLSLTTSGRLWRIVGISGVGRLPLSIAFRQREAALATLGDHAPVQIDLLPVPAAGPGTFLFLKAETDGVPAGFTSLGARGKRAESVGAEAAEELLAHLATGAPLDPHLADQIVPYLALCPGESTFTTSRITRHLLTNLWVAGLFRPLRVRVTGAEGEPGEVSILPG